MLKVVHKASGDNVPVVTAHLDRRAKRWCGPATPPRPTPSAPGSRPDGVAIEGTEERAPGVVIDFDAGCDVVGIKVLNVSLRGRKALPVAERPAAE